MENELGGKFRERGAHFLVYRRARGKQGGTGNTLKSKATTVTGHGDPEGCEMLRDPHCLDNLLTVNCEILATCSSTYSPVSTSQEARYVSIK
jgi:hypothetical protein